MFGMMKPEDWARVHAESPKAEEPEAKHVVDGLYFGRRAIVHKETLEGYQYITNPNPQNVDALIVDWNRRIELEIRKARKS